MIASSSLTRCDACGAEIAAGLLACPGCARLLHRDELARLARAAEEAERAGDLTTALAAWRRATELLPARTQQRSHIEARMQGLSAAIDGRAAPAGAAHPARSATSGTSSATSKVGTAAGVGTGLTLLLANGKVLLLGLTKVPTLISMLFYLPWLSGQGIGFALGLIASIYVHEMGHVAALARYGIQAGAPTFVPGFGAFVRMKQYPTDAHEEARTGLAGPLWGLFAAVVAAAIGLAAHLPTALAVASWGGIINLFNLIPFWQLDGARGLRALSRSQRLAVAAVALVMSVALYAARVDERRWMLAVIAVMTFAQAFAKDAHPRGDRGMCALFVALVIGHSLIAMLASGARLF